jgi:hypothetical protein
MLEEPNENEQLQEIRLLTQNGKTSECVGKEGSIIFVSAWPCACKAFLLPHPNKTAALRPGIELGMTNLCSSPLPPLSHISYLPGEWGKTMPATVENNHHVAGKGMCVGFFVVGF